MTNRKPFFTEYRTVRGVPWWFPHAEKTAFALLIVVVMVAASLLFFGVPEGPR
jgi:hypothetical protein